MSLPLWQSKELWPFLLVFHLGTLLTVSSLAKIWQGTEVFASFRDLTLLATQTPILIQETLEQSFCSSDGYNSSYRGHTA